MILAYHSVAFLTNRKGLKPRRRNAIRARSLVVKRPVCTGVSRVRFSPGPFLGNGVESKSNGEIIMVIRNQQQIYMMELRPNPNRLWNKAGAKYKFEFSKPFPSMNERAGMAVEGTTALEKYTRYRKEHPKLVGVELHPDKIRTIIFE